MIRNLKIVALAAMAILAVSAVAAQAASAAAYNSNSPTGNTNISGEQSTTNEFSVTTGIVKCSKAVFTGTQAGNEASSITVHPEYSGCKLAGIAATVTTTGCNYKFEKTGGNEAEGTSNKVAVVCETGKSITVSKEGCTVTVGSQSGLETVKITNSNPNVTVTANVAKIAYSESGATCSAPGSHTDGTYKGSVIEKGTEDGGSGLGVKIWVA
jgi:hypothetical protein